jgi:hypothetical protein
VWRETTNEYISAQAVNPGAGLAYALVSRASGPAGGPWVLESISLRTGSVHRGPAFPVGGLALASGYLWIYGVPSGGTQPVVSQLNPLTLARVRSVSLPKVPDAYAGLPMALATGPADSVWMGSFRTLLRVSAATGVALSRVQLPAALAISNLSVDPAFSRLYVAAARLVGSDGVEGAVVVEYDARSGQRLAMASGGIIRDSVAGAQLTAMPGGVWVSFRTGMLGLSILLRQRDLAVIAPTNPEAASLQPADGIFHWPMYSQTVYGGGALWLADQVGIVACIDPGSGTVRAMERLPQAQLASRLPATNPASHVVFAIETRGLVEFIPPRGCWS